MSLFEKLKALFIKKAPEPVKEDIEEDTSIDVEKEYFNARELTAYFKELDEAVRAVQPAFAADNCAELFRLQLRITMAWDDITRHQKHYEKHLRHVEFRLE